MPIPKAKTDQQRALIQLIHVGKNDLALDDDTYRHLLVETTKKTSTKLMTTPQLNSVLAAMKERGFVVKSKAGTRPKAADPQSKKIRALWLELHKIGAVQDSSEAALAAYVKRITAVEALQWLSQDQSSKVIETLKQWFLRVHKGV